MNLESNPIKKGIRTDAWTTSEAARADCLIDKAKLNNENVKCDVTSREVGKTTTNEETGCLMDVLHLHMLQLIEDQISQQLSLEAETSRARLMLAKIRLQHGNHHIAATSRLPGFTPYRALCRIVEQGVKWSSSFKLLRFDVEPARGYLLPVTQIFGGLVSATMRLASRKWEQCVEQIGECVNVQRELQSVVESIEQLNWTLHRRNNI